MSPAWVCNPTPRIVFHVFYPIQRPCTVHCTLQSHTHVINVSMHIICEPILYACLSDGWTLKNAWFAHLIVCCVLNILNILATFVPIWCAHLYLHTIPIPHSPADGRSALCAPSLLLLISTYKYSDKLVLGTSGSRLRWLRWRGRGGGGGGGDLAVSGSAMYNVQCMVYIRRSKNTFEFDYLCQCTIG